MRVDPHGVGSIMHVVKRGTRGADIVRDDKDRRHFKESLFYLNDVHKIPNFRKLEELVAPYRPQEWPERKPLVAVLAWTLMPNHFHLILEEISDGGIAKFMQRLCGSMSARFNARHEEKGSLFQGPYKGRIVVGDADLRWLASYVMVKNVLELREGGIALAVQDFDHAWKDALEYQFSSLAVYASDGTSPLMPLASKNSIIDVCGVGNAFKRNSEDMLHAFVEKAGSGEIWE